MKEFSFSYEMEITLFPFSAILRIFFLNFLSKEEEYS